jgi:hypothetical protein
MSQLVVHKGLPFRTVFYWIGGLDAALTEAKFQVRSTADEGDTQLLAVTQADGVTITASTTLAEPIRLAGVTYPAGTVVGKVAIVVPTSQTEALPVTLRTQQARAQLRLYAPGDATKTTGTPEFAITLAPEVIND